MDDSRSVAGGAVSNANASGVELAVPGLAGSRHHRRHRQQPIGVLDRHDLHDHPAHRQAHHVRPLDTDRVEHGDRIGRHVGERVRGTVAVDRGVVELGRQSDVAVVEAHRRAKPAGDEHLAPVLVVVDALAARDR